MLGTSKKDFERVWKRWPEKLVEIGKREMWPLPWGEELWGKSKVIKEDFKEALQQNVS